jgi:hypothetical protein
MWPIRSLPAISVPPSAPLLLPHTPPSPPAATARRGFCPLRVLSRKYRKYQVSGPALQALSRDVLGSAVHVAVELLLLLIDGDAASQKIVRDTLGVKFVLMSLINVELQSGSDFDEEYMQDCLWIVLSVCGASNQVPKKNASNIVLISC